MKLFVFPGKAGGVTPALNLTTLIVCKPWLAVVGISNPQIVKFAGAVK